MPCFNLAIEMLVISGQWTEVILDGLACFNLAIEMLVISGQLMLARCTGDAVLFQSRNRDACHFR